MTVFDMLKDLQENKENDSEGWILAWDYRLGFKRWVCSLCDHEQHPYGTPLKLFAADNPYDCVREAWKSEKEARRMNDGAEAEDN